MCIFLLGTSSSFSPLRFITPFDLWTRRLLPRGTTELTIKQSCNLYWYWIFSWVSLPVTLSLMDPWWFLKCVCEACSVLQHLLWTPQLPTLFQLTGFTCGTERCDATFLSKLLSPGSIQGMDWTKSLTINTSYHFFITLTIWWPEKDKESESKAYFSHFVWMDISPFLLMTWVVRGLGPQTQH